MVHMVHILISLDFLPLFAVLYWCTLWCIWCILLCAAAFFPSRLQQATLGMPVKASKNAYAARVWLFEPYPLRRLLRA